jgi:hypothetical protein
MKGDEEFTADRKEEKDQGNIPSIRGELGIYISTSLERREVIKKVVDKS